jgi:hypothetical protein
MKNKKPYYPNPYENLSNKAFWKSGVVDEDPLNIQSLYKKKFNLDQDTSIASAGSCFAQHISKYLLSNGFDVIDKEKAPQGLPEKLKSSYGYNMFSARFGNIYSVKQLLQLTKEAAGLLDPKDYIWKKGNKFYDAFRPSIEFNGFNSKSEVIEHRKFHLINVKAMFEKMDVLIFTMGLTQTWTNRYNQLVYPSAPGIIAGQFNPSDFELVNAEYNEILSDFNEFTKIIDTLRKAKSQKCKFILTVSPVPLTATALNEHVLLSSIYSKSVLRAVAGKLSQKNNIDYFPSYEIVNNPRLEFSPFEENLRTVKKSTVDNVMKHFFAEHKPLDNKKNKPFKKMIEVDPQCDDALLEGFKNC